MKRWLAILMSVLMLVTMVPALASAEGNDAGRVWAPEDFTYGEWELSTTSGSAGSGAVFPGDDFDYMLPGTKWVVTGFSEAGTAKLIAGNTDLVIPAQDPDGRKVQGVSQDAFNANTAGKPLKVNNIKLTSVTFPEGVMTTDHIADVNSNWGGAGYLGKHGPLTEIGDFFIGYGAFRYNNFEELVLPKGVIHINTYAFANNTKLKKVTFPETIMLIGQGSFFNGNSAGAGAISELVFPAETDVRLSMTQQAFAGNSLASVQLPKDTLKIGKWAFMLNKGSGKPVTSGTAAEKKGEIVDLSFRGSKTGMMLSDNIHNYIAQPKSESVEAGEATCEEAGHTAGYKCLACGKFFNDAALTEEQETTPALGHDWGEGEVVKTPTAEADGEIKYTCKRDASHTRTEQVKYEWEASDFTYSEDGATVTGLTPAGIAKLDWNPDMLLPGKSDGGVTVTAVGKDAFNATSSAKSYYAKITNVRFPESITSIGQTAFSMCSIKELVLPDTIKSLAIGSFNSNAGLSKITLSKSLTEIPNGCFATNAASMDPETGVHDIVIPEGVTKIGVSAFNGQHVRNLTLPSTLESIGNLAFQNHQISELEIPASVKTIGTDAFHFTQEGPPKTLAKLTLHEGLTSIGSRAFGGSILKEVDIPDSVTSIHKDAFKARSLGASQTTLCKISEKSPLQGTADGSCHKYGTAYKITFNAGEGAKASSEFKMTDPETGKLSELAQATSEDACKKMDAWYTAAEGGEKVTTDTEFSASTVVYAQWKPNHTLEKTDAVAATCEQAGNIEYYTCSVCDKLFADAEGTNEISVEDTVVKATDHDWGEPTYDWAADKSTVTAKRVCKNDATHVETETAEASPKETKAATCDEAGEIEYSAEFENSAFAKQTDTVAVEAFGHDYGEWAKLDDASHQRVCTRDASHVEKKAHQWDNGVVTKEATETAAGTKLYTCSVCAATKTEAIPKKAPKGKTKVTLGTTKVGTVANYSKKTMVVSWKKVSGATGYKLSYRMKGGKWTTKTVTGNKYTVKGMKVGKLYEFKVAATKKATAKTEAATGKYSPVHYRYFKTIKARAKGLKNSVRLTWNKDKNANGYIVYIATNKNMKNPKSYVVKGASRKSYTFKGLKKGKRYYVMVRAYKNSGGHRYDGITGAIKSAKAR